MAFATEEWRDSLARSAGIQSLRSASKGALSPNRFEEEQSRSPVESAA